MANILTNEEVRRALYLDEDADSSELEEYSRTASSYIKQKTGYDFGADEQKEPLAISCAKLYIKQQHFGSANYNKEHDYSLGITSLLVDLQIIAKEKLAGTTNE